MTHTQGEDNMTSEEITLSDVILDIAAGPFGSNLKVSCFVDDGFPIIDGANLKGFKVTDNVTKFVTEEKARSLHRAIAKRGDVVVTISGTLGQIAYIPEDSQYEEYLVSQRQFRVTFDESKVCIPYIVYYFHSFEGQHKILMFANQVGVPALAQPLKNFRQIKMNLPPLDVQRRIAAVLKPLDDKIELNARINARLERVAQTLFKRHFVRFEPYGGTMPPGWRVGTLSEIAEFVGGYSYKSSELKESNTAMATIKNFDRKGGFKLDGFKELVPSAKIKQSQYAELFDTFVAHTDLTQNAEVVGNAEMLMSKAGYERIAFSMDLVKVVPKTPDISKFTIAALLRNSRFKAHCLHYVNGTTVLHLNKKALPEYKIALPKDLSELRQFNELITPIYKMIAYNIDESRTLARLRDVLLPRLMSGAVDVGQVRLNTIQEGGSR